MKTVQPIRDEKKIEAMKKILKGKSLRDYAFFTLGINTGLRISDNLNFTFSDVLNRRKSITRQQAYNIINYATEFAGVEEAVGTHTMRKTFGYHAY